MMDWKDFEAKAARVLPPHELKPKRCWIGVLNHMKSPEDTLEEADFVWMIGHSKVPTQKLYDTYHKFHEGIEVLLKFKDVPVKKNDSVNSFMIPPNNLLVLFTACLPDHRTTTPKPRPATPDMLRTPPRAVPTQRQPEPYRPSLPASPLPTRVKNEPQDDTDLSLNQARSNTARDERPSTTSRTLEADLAISPAQQGLPVKDELKPDPALPPHLDTETQLPFDPDNFFHRGSSPTQASQEETEPTDQYIRKIIDYQDPRVLEAGVAQSMIVLGELKGIFARHAGHPDAVAWTGAIDKLIPQAQRKRTIVGVVGNTGAGKSSVINAMLDEERLVPTNCMRACTAVVTEMSYNESHDPSKKYHAQIEFISQDDWAKEVATLMKEFLTESGGIAREASDENSDAGVAWAKFHSVYPKIARDSLAAYPVGTLLSDRSVNAVLGTTKTITSAYPGAFYRQLQRYVDSKEKVTKKRKDKVQEKPKSNFEMEYWPLIKVVRIYVKAQPLSTGAVIVDLPGVHDSNAARAAVAQGYMKQCTGLWIVAPITRAVDDKAAKTLLGDTFKRQLKFDGGFSSVTFICSKTDDISITEAIDTLELEVDVLYDNQHAYEAQIEKFETRIDDLKESQEVFRLAQKEASDNIETWDELKERLEDGHTVYAPRPRMVKRKNTRFRKTDAHKRRRGARDDSEDDFIASDEEEAESQNDSNSDDEEVEAPATPLSGDEIKSKIKEYKETKKGARREISELALQIKELKPQVSDLKSKIREIKTEISRICIAGRNDYSKRAIQQDFAAGLKELDQENAAEEDEANFNPDEESRDYDDVAKSLPVFCVSSRAYQKICGRLQKDDAVPGFKLAEETEMPQLQAHCTKLTEAGRIQTARTFLLSLCQQLTTFSLWASNDGTGLKMTDDEMQKQASFLDRKLGELECGLEESVNSSLGIMKRELNNQIFDRYPVTKPRV